VRFEVARADAKDSGFWDVTVNVRVTDCSCSEGIRKVKGKAVLLQAWTGPEGSRKIRFPDFTTTAQDSGKVVSPMHRPPLPP